ncbi:ROK family transcriptional regulator [Streptomyces sp. NPDC057340]|uniref:ROK family transcriptional regulator n=1 Tax=Streptomyces sp. NPDC057340 TaxID=3346103 RepID=UPI0036421C48
MSTSPAPRASERRLIELIAAHGPLTRAELTELSGIPRRTVSGAAARLLARGLLTQKKTSGCLPDGPRTEEARRRGPTADALHLPDTPGGVLVVLITHEDIAVCEVGPDGRRTPVAKEPFQWWTCTDPAVEVERLLTAVPGRDPVQRVSRMVLGVPQPYRQDHGVTLLGEDVPGYYGIDEYPAWLTTDLAAALSHRFGVPAHVENLINLAALGEASAGAARGRHSVLYLRLGDIVAGAVVVQGHVLRGALGAAGEIGHIRVDPHGMLCACGGRGCLGTVANARHLLDVLRPRYGQDLDLFDVVALAVQGDRTVRGVLTDLGRTVGMAIAGGLLMLNPETVVIDPVLGPATAPVIDGLIEAVHQTLPATLARALTVVPGMRQDDAAFIGGRALADRGKSSARR